MKISNKKNQFILVQSLTVRKSSNRSTLGFTLIELLVVIAILTTVGVFIASTLFLTLRGAAKTAISATVRQNGNAAVLQFEQDIRSAKSLDNIIIDGNSPPSPITSCTTPVSGPPDPTNGSVALVFTNFDNGSTTLTCDSGNDDISSSSGSLNYGDFLDTSKVQLTSCSITCTQPTVYSPPIFKIKFQLTNSGSATFENSDTQTFETTVNMLDNIQGQ